MGDRERAPRTDREKTERPPRDGDTASNSGGPADGRRRQDRDKERERAKPAGDDGKVSLLVRNLSRKTTSEEIKKFFEQYGVIKDVYLPKDYYSGEARGFGFVEFADADEAEAAQKNLDHTPLDGREVTVVFAQERRKSSNEMRGRETEDGKDGAGSADGSPPPPAPKPKKGPPPPPTPAAATEGAPPPPRAQPAAPKAAPPPKAAAAAAPPPSARPAADAGGPRPTTAVASSAPIAARPAATVGGAPRPSAAAPTTPAWGRGGIPLGVKEAAVPNRAATATPLAGKPAAEAAAAPPPAAAEHGAAQQQQPPAAQPAAPQQPAAARAAPAPAPAAPAPVAQPPIWATLDATQRIGLRPKVGVGVFITSPQQHPGAVLVGARTDSDSSVIWALPGGHLEYAEDWISCAAREVAEQTGLVAKNIRFATLDNSIEVTHDYHYVVIFCVCEVESEPVNKEADKVQSWQWAVWDSPEFDSMPLFAGLHNVRSAGYHPFKHGGQALPVLPPHGALSW